MLEASPFGGRELQLQERGCLWTGPSPPSRLRRLGKVVHVPIQQVGSGGRLRLEKVRLPGVVSPDPFHTVFSTFSKKLNLEAAEGSFEGFVGKILVLRISRGRKVTTQR